MAQWQLPMNLSSSQAENVQAQQVQELNHALTQLQQEICDRQQIEKELKASQQLLQLVFNTLPQRIFWKDRQSRYLGCNQWFAQDAGVRSPNEVIGKDDYDFPWQEQAHLYRADDASVMATNTPRINYEERQTRPDGTEVWLQTSKIPLRDEQGDVIGVFGSYEEITERKTTELALRQSEEKFRTLVSNITGAVYQCLYDDHWTMDFISDAIEEISGYPATDFTGNRIRTYSSVIHPEDRASVSAGVEQAIANRQSFVLEYRLIHRNGSIRWVNERGKAIFTPDGTPLYLEGVIFDISDRKATEQSLREQVRVSSLRAEIDSILSRADHLQAMLQQCCERIVEFLDAAFVRIWTHNPQGAVLELQASAGLYTHIDGAHSRIPVGQFQIGLIAAERQPHLTNDVLNDPRVGDQEWARRTGIMAFAGYPLIVEQELVGVIALFAYQPLSEMAIDVLSFISAELALGIKRKQAEMALVHSEACLRQQTQELEQTLHELQQAQMQLIQSEKMSSLGQLVAGIAHEINNPVNFIHGNIAHANEYTQALLNLIRLYQEHYPHPTMAIQGAADEMDLEFLSADLPKLLASMKIGADRIRQIVLSLRSFSRLDEAEFKAVNIHEGIDSTLIILDNRLKPKGNRPWIEVIKEYGQLPLVECYAGQINQVFMNILTNAIDALEEQDQQRSLKQTKELPGQIHIQTKLVNATQVAIVIRDNGPGIPDAIQRRIFDPFFTTKPVGKGTGMGMSISHQIITKNHHGLLLCHSSPGKGSEFVIQIPIHQKKQ